MHCIFYRELQRREAEERQKVIDTLTPGAILHLTGISSEDVTMDDFKNYFGDYATVKWVDFNKGDNQVLEFQKLHLLQQYARLQIHVHVHCTNIHWHL